MAETMMNRPPSENSLETVLELIALTQNGDLAWVDERESFLLEAIEAAVDRSLAKDSEVPDRHREQVRDQMIHTLMGQMGLYATTYQGNTLRLVSEGAPSTSERRARLTHSDWSPFFRSTGRRRTRSTQPEWRQEDRHLRGARFRSLPSTYTCRIGPTTRTGLSPRSRSTSSLRD